MTNAKKKKVGKKKSEWKDEKKSDGRLFGTEELGTPKKVAVVTIQGGRSGGAANYPDRRRSRWHQCRSQ